MDKYQDKEAAMDDYSHEKKLAHDGRAELVEGNKSAAEDDFAHAHYLKDDAHDDAIHRVLKHSRANNHIS